MDEKIINVVARENGWSFKYTKRYLKHQELKKNIDECGSVKGLKKILIDTIDFLFEEEND